MGRTKEKAHEKAHDVKEDIKLPFYLNTRTLTSHLFYGPYIWIPLLCSIVWLGGILAMLGVWVAEGKPRYRDDLPSVVFISHVGAVHHKLFMGIACTTAGLFIMSTFAERWLRGIDRLPADLRRREKVFDWLAIACAIIGSLGLILCSIFTAFEHGTFHWSMALVFIAFTALCAIFQSAEIWSLHKDHPDRRHLLRNSIVKLVVITFAVAGAISFGVTYGICGGGPQATNGHTYEQCDRISSACAALEWTIAFILFFYFLTLIADLWPAGKSSSRYMRRLARWQEKHAPQLAPTVATANGRPQFMGDDFTGRGAFAQHPKRWMTAEQRAEAMEREMKARNQGMRLAHEEENVGNRYMGNGPEVPMQQQHQQQPVSANAPYTTHVDPNAGYSNGQMGAPASYPNTAEATPRHSEASYAPMMRNAA